MKYLKIGLFALIFVLFGCAKASDNQSAKEETKQKEFGEWRIALSAQPATLDTHMTTAIVTRDVARNIFETLVTFNSDYEVVPMLAKSFDVSEDGKVYTFNLRQGVKFHNGDTMTVEDVIASMNRWLERSMSAQMLLKDAVFEKKDDDTVELYVKEPSSLLLSVLAATNQFGAIMPKETIDKASAEGVDEYIGTGPFKFVEWKQDQYIHLEKFDNYQSVDSPSDGLAGRKDAPVQDIFYEIVTDSSTRISGIQTGQYDIAEGMPYQSYEQIKNDPNINVHTPFYGQQVLIFEKYEGIFANPKMREAVNLALDTDKISLAAFSDNEDIYRLTSSYMLKEQPWFSEAGNEFYNQKNAEKAKELIKQAGYDGEEIRFLTTRDYEHIYNASVVIQQQLKEIGMNVSLEVYDWATVLNLRTEPAKWELFLTGFPAVTIPAEFLAFTSQYYIDPEDEKYMTLYEKVKSSTSTEEAMVAWDELQAYAWEYLPVIKLSDFAQVFSTAKDIGDFTYLDGPVLWNISKE